MTYKGHPVMCDQCITGNCRACRNDRFCECKHPEGRYPEQERYRNKRMKSDPKGGDSVRTVSGGLPSLGRRRKG